MNRLGKFLGVVGSIILIISQLAACSKAPDENRINPEISLESYMELVKSGEIENSHDYMHGVVLKSYSDDDNRDTILGDAWEERIQTLDGHEKYLEELKSMYSSLDYVVINTHKREGSNQKEFTIDLTTPNIDRVNDELRIVAEDHLSKITYSDDEETMLNIFDEMYFDLSDTLINIDPKIDTISGEIVFIKGGADDNVPEGEWIISAMDYELFNRLAIRKDI